MIRPSLILAVCFAAATTAAVASPFDDLVRAGQAVRAAHGFHASERLPSRTLEMDYVAPDSFFVELHGRRTRLASPDIAGIMHAYDASTLRGSTRRDRGRMTIGGVATEYYDVITNGKKVTVWIDSAHHPVRADAFTSSGVISVLYTNWR